MKLISWNVNGLRACMTKGFAEYFASQGADAFCIQETKLQPGQIDFAPEGYHCYWNSADKKGYSGTAIFSRQEPLSVRYDMGVEEHVHGRAAKISTECDGFYQAPGSANWLNHSSNPTGFVYNNGSILPLFSLAKQCLFHKPLQTKGGHTCQCFS